MHMADGTDVALTVRIPVETLERIDVLVKARQTRIPRHSWLLEAIYEKLFKEERVQGDLEILLESSKGAVVTSVYRLRFFRLDRQKGSPVVPMTVVGDDSLERYLIEWDLSAENAKRWIQKLKTDRSISVRGVIVPAERAGRYGFRAPGGGIQIELGDGKTALMSPDLVNLPDGTKAYRIRTWGHGSRGTAMVAADGRALIVLGEHIWPPGHPPGTIILNLAEASEEEAKELLDIYRQFVPD
jgi:hypothetical protein